MDMDTIELEFCLEEEKKKCLKNIQHYYRKYGCAPVQKLQEYLISLQESQSEEEREYIKKELERLDTYN